MTDRSKAQVLSLADDSGPLVVKRGGLGMRVEFNSSGAVDIFTNIPVTIHPAANDSALSGTTPKIGDLMPDGGVYVGKSATTGKHLHAAIADEPEYLTFDESFDAAAKMRNQPGRENAHVPTPEELDKNLFDNNTARVQWFDLGDQDDRFRYDRLPVRLVW